MRAESWTNAKPTGRPGRGALVVPPTAKPFWSISPQTPACVMSAADATGNHGRPNGLIRGGPG